MRALLGFTILLAACSSDPDCWLDFRSCELDEDCISVPIETTCGCENMGESTGINSACEDAWNDKHDLSVATCSPVNVCEMVVPVCDQGQCVFF
jgi:hypothetical protein